jgi:hypothetical protein
MRKYAPAILIAFGAFTFAMVVSLAARAIGCFVFGVQC